jgi:UDP-glucose 4-epimerase
MIEDIPSDYRQPMASIRFASDTSNASGADASGQIGECHDPETHLIPRAMMALLG